MMQNRGGAWQTTINLMQLYPTPLSSLKIKNQTVACHRKQKPVFNKLLYFIVTELFDQEEYKLYSKITAYQLFSYDSRQKINNYFKLYNHFLASYTKRFYTTLNEILIFRKF